MSIKNNLWILRMAKVKETECKEDLHSAGAKNEEMECKVALHESDIVRTAHYKGKSMECIDVIHDFELNYNLGNAVKYILRAGKKGDRITDIKKALWYINKEIGNE